MTAMLYLLPVRCKDLVIPCILAFPDSCVSLTGKAVYRSRPYQCFLALTSVSATGIPCAVGQHTTIDETDEEEEP